MGDKLRVAMISLHTNPLAQPGIGNAGGMNVYVLKLAVELAHLGVQVELFTRSDKTVGGENATHPILPIQIVPGVRLWEIPTQNSGDLTKEQLINEVSSFTERALEIIIALGEKPVQLIHTHYWLSGISGLEIARLLNIPLIHAMHTMGKAKNAALPPGDVPEPLERLTGESIIVENADALIAATEHEAHELETHYAADPTKVWVIPPGVDRGVFHPAGSYPAKSAIRERLGFASLDIPLAAKIVLFAGRIQRLKNPGILVHALPALPPDTYLVILGGVSGHAKGEAELVALATELGVASRVRILAPVPASTLANWYRAADLVAVPSYNESYGLVAAEAIGSGCPVVAARVGGLKTVVTDGVTGLLVDSHEPADWALALGKLLTDAELRRHLAANCANDATLYDWQRTALETLAVYQALTHRA